MQNIYNDSEEDVVNADFLIKSEFIVDVFCCPRCSETHSGLSIKTFKKPAIYKGIEFTFWGMCPDTKEPILLRNSLNKEET